MEKISNALVETGIPIRGELLEHSDRATNPLGSSPFVCFQFGEADEKHQLIEKR